MVSIYQTFPQELIEVNDDYTENIRLQIIHSVHFQANPTEENSFLACVATKGDKIQSFSNRQFFYIPEILHGCCGLEYSKRLRSTYESILHSKKDDVEIIKTPVFYFMDYDSANGTGHTYDVLSYLLYMYKIFNLSCPIVIPNTKNRHFRSLIQLLQSYYDVKFLEIECGKTYQFETVFFVRTYLNLFLSEVKDFLNTTLIEPILEKYKDIPSYESIARLKLRPKGVLNTPQAIFDVSDDFLLKCKEHSIFFIEEDMPEDLKIYYMNKAKRILVCWGSIYYIYIDYYLKSTEDKFISVLFHKSMMPERESLIGSTDRIYQRMYHCDRNIPQIYNSLSFQGEVIDNIETLNEYLARSSLFKQNTL